MKITIGARVTDTPDADYHIEPGDRYGIVTNTDAVGRVTVQWDDGLFTTHAASELRAV